MGIKICFVTNNRAEYGLIHPLIKTAKKLQKFEVSVIATCSHLASSFGRTISEIEKDGVLVDYEIECLVDSSTPQGAAVTIGNLTTQIGLCFQRIKPDWIVVLGDRYELLAIASAATVHRIPIAHIAGGDVTKGAFDDQIRHAITKLSYLHFTSNTESQRRVIQMGEDKSRVFATGCLSKENFHKTPKLSKAEIEKRLNTTLPEKVALVTFHSETNNPGRAYAYCKETLKALDESSLFSIITQPNQDPEGREIEVLIQEYTDNNPDKAIYYKSLGRELFISTLAISTIMIGNSSAGIAEAPLALTPTLNLGERQSGRPEEPSIITLQTPDLNSIREAINTLLESKYEYKDNHSNQDIALEILETIFSFQHSSSRKDFVDLTP